MSSKGPVSSGASAFQALGNSSVNKEGFSLADAIPSSPGLILEASPGVLSASSVVKHHYTSPQSNCIPLHISDKSCLSTQLGERKAAEKGTQLSFCLGHPLQALSYISTVHGVKGMGAITQKVTAHILTGLSLPYSLWVSLSGDKFLNETGAKWIKSPD